MAWWHKDYLFDMKANREAYNFWAKKQHQRIQNPAKRDILCPPEPPHAFGISKHYLTWFLTSNPVANKIFRASILGEKLLQGAGPGQGQHRGYFGERWQRDRRVHRNWYQDQGRHGP